MDKGEICRLLTEHGVPYEIIEHEAVFTVEEAERVYSPYPEGGSKSLFVRDGKRERYYLITVREDKRVDLKSFKKAHSLHGLSFASGEELFGILGVTPGAVTPFGLLNDKEKKAELCLDRDFLGGMIAVHPNENTATLWLKTEDLVRVLREQGSAVNLEEF